MEQLHTHDLDALTNEEAHFITLSWQIVPVS
jgi:hypothetical protein